MMKLCVPTNNTLNKIININRHNVYRSVYPVLVGSMVIFWNKIKDNDQGYMIEGTGPLIKLYC